MTGVLWLGVGEKDWVVAACRTSGARLLFSMVTPPSRAGLTYAAPPGLVRDGACGLLGASRWIILRRGRLLGKRRQSLPHSTLGWAAVSLRMFRDQGCALGRRASRLIGVGRQEGDPSSLRSSG